MVGLLAERTFSPRRPRGLNLSAAGDNKTKRGRRSGNQEWLQSLTPLLLNIMSQKITSDVRSGWCWNIKASGNWSGECDMIIGLRPQPVMAVLSKGSVVPLRSGAVRSVA